MAIVTISPRTLKERINRRTLTLLTTDTLDRLSGKRNGMIPPTRHMFDGPSDIESFRNNGTEFLNYFIKLGALKPSDRVLDVGSGMGRKTLPLTGYLNDKGSYEGLEIVKRGVDWCNKKIHRKYPNFNFRLADVYNELYNPNGQYPADKYNFPYNDNEFDFVILGSVFTHMLPQDLENYLTQIARVLKPGGRALISYFLINKESRQLIESNTSSIDIRHKQDKYYTADPKNLEGATGYDEDYIMTLYKNNGLGLFQPVQYGSWCGRKKYLSYQDLIIGVKK